MTTTSIPTVTSQICATLNHGFLASHEEYELIRSAQKGNQDAMSELVAHNARYLYKIACHYYTSGYCGDLEFADIYHWAVAGFIVGVRKFDLSTNYRLLTYATHWVRQVIDRKARYSGRNLSLSYHAGQMLTKIRAIEARSAQEISDQQIAAEVHAPAQTVNELRRFPRAVHSLDNLLADDTDETFENQLRATQTASDADSPEELVEASDTLAQLRQKLGHLPANQRQVLILRHGLKDGLQHSTAQIAGKMGLSCGQVKRLEKSAIKSLRELLE